MLSSYVKKSEQSDYDVFAVEVHVDAETAASGSTVIN